MFKKIHIANRGDRRSEAETAAKPHCMAREARAGDLAAGSQHV
jgi:hypothetical protein